MPRGAGHRPLRRRPPGRGLRGRLALAHAPHPRGGPRERLDPRRARGHQPRRHAAPSPARGLLLRARPVVAGRLLDRRQRRRELGRRALPQVRLHDEPRPRARRWCSPTATVVDLGGPAPDAPGYDLLAALVGSRGARRHRHRGDAAAPAASPRPPGPSSRPSPPPTRRGTRSPASSPPGILPAAIEMMDRLAIEAAKAATGLDWPDVGAALLMDADGPRAEVEHVSARAIEIARAAGRARDPGAARRGRAAAHVEGAQERLRRGGPHQPELPRGGRRHPALRDRPRCSARSSGWRREVGLRVANVFHAGDGNLHPLVLYDARNPGEEERAAQLGGEILRLCIRSRRLHHRRARRRRREGAVHGRAVRRGRPRDDGAGPLRLRRRSPS